MPRILLKNATALTANRFTQGDILIEDQYIAKIEKNIDCAADKVIDCKGLLVLPGLIDAHVHFRQPGMEQKANIFTESRAAALGGVTSYMEMPNTMPPTTTIEALNNKKDIAKKDSLVNYGFYLGASADNLEEVKRVDPHDIAGIKIYMGSTTGNLLLDDDNSLLKVFKAAPTLIATHCEDNDIVNRNTSEAKKRYGENIPFSMHPIIRSRDCCLKSTTLAVQMALEADARLHVMHLSTAEEVDLMRQFNKGDIKDRKITAEACIPHLFFNESDYDRLHGFLKCNPAVKYERDRRAIIQGLRQGVISTIGTDHAPHEISVKESSDYLKVASGLPSVQYSLPVIFELFKRGEFTLEEGIKAATINTAKLFGIAKRGLIAEGYFADIAIIDPIGMDHVHKDDIFSLCKWSPFEGSTFRCKVLHTICSGNLVVENAMLIPTPARGCALRFADEV